MRAPGTLWLSVLALAALALPSQAQPVPRLGGVTVLEVARHAVIAQQIVDYEGTKVLSVLRGDSMETTIVSEAHKRPGKSRLEYLSPEGLAGRVVIDDGLTSWHYEPRLHTVFEGPSLAPPSGVPSPGLFDRKRISLLGTEEVIGRPTAVLRMEPLAGRGERRLWVDRTTGVTLRYEERDPEEGLVMTSYFTRISFGLNMPDALFRPRVPAGARVVNVGPPTAPLLPVAEVEKSLRLPLPVPETLPGGFVLAGGRAVESGLLRAAHMHYRDGARSVALFVARSSQMGPPGRGEPVAELGPGARSLTVGVMRLLLWEDGGRRFTLVGPLPVADLVSMALALSMPRAR